MASTFSTIERPASGARSSRLRPPLPAFYVEAIRDIARRLERLAPDYADPRRYHQRRDNLADELDQLTR